MNSKFFLLLLAVPFLFGCNGRTKNLEQSVASVDSASVIPTTVVEAEETPAMCGWKCYGLLGRVKSVRYSDGSCLEFNSDGNLTKQISVSMGEGGKHIDTQINVYSSPNEYSCGDTKYKIEYKKNTRSEIEQMEEHFSDRFIFDKLGRIAKFYPNMGFDALTIEYLYKSEKDVWPNIQTQDGGVEIGSSTIVNRFEYMKADNRGNWTERKIYRKVSETDEVDRKSVKTETLTEKREITYF